MVKQSQTSPPPVPGRYVAPSSRTYQLREAGTWHLVYRTTGHVSDIVVGISHGTQRADVDAILADPDAAAVRAGRCPRCQTPCGPDHGADDCRSAKLWVAS